MPYFHCGGCVMSTLGSIATGSAQLPAVTFDAGADRPDDRGGGRTSASLVPTMMIALEEEVAERRPRPPARCELVVTGGSPVPPEVKRHWIERYGVGHQQHLRDDRVPRR